MSYMHPIYANQTARFDGSARALTEDEMRKVAPSIFAVEKHDSRSDRFQPIPTIEIVRALQSEGFSPVGAKQGGTRDETRRDFTKHMLRFRRLDQDQKFSVGDSVFEILLKNANDGTAAYDLMGGMFRIRCTNSLVSQISTVDSVKVRHTGTAEAIQGKVIEGTYEVLKSAELLLAAPQDWGQITLDRDEQMIMAAAAHEYRFGAAEGEPETPQFRAYQPEQFLRPNRRDDGGSDLWTKFNVIQEHAIKGDLTARGRIDGRRPAMRAVKNIDGDIKLNKALWAMAEQMAALKGFKRAA